MLEFRIDPLERRSYVEKAREIGVDLRVGWKTNLGFVSMFVRSFVPIDAVRWPMDTDFARKTTRESIFVESSMVHEIVVWLSTCLSRSG